MLSIRLTLTTATLALWLGHCLQAQQPTTAPTAPKPVSSTSPAQKPAPPAPKPGPVPTFANVAYGTHERQVLDFYQAKSSKPTPLVFFIHGGGWVAGDKSKVSGVPDYLAAGISVAAINYRYTSQAQAAKIEPPVKAPLEDAARALQFVRSKAKEWNIDPKRIGATGGSAGGASTCWLCTHDDMANPSSTDPVARESTRLLCGAPVGAQTCFDPRLLREWLPNMSYGGHAYGFSKFQDFYDGRDKVMPWVKEYSAYHLVTRDDSPMFLQYSLKNNEPPVVGQPAADPTHSAVLGIKFAEKLKEAGVEHYLCYPGGPQSPWTSATQFLIARLKAESPK
jgi:acetyl esterase/lipase